MRDGELGKIIVSVLIASLVAVVGYYGARFDSQAKKLEDAVSALNVTTKALQVYIEQRGLYRDEQLRVINGRIEALEKRGKR